MLPCSMLRDTREAVCGCTESTNMLALSSITVCCMVELHGFNTLLAVELVVQSQTHVQAASCFVIEGRKALR